MSANGDGNGDDEVPGRELAYRLFAAEYDDATLSYAESDEERAPNYVITPTGARLNRVFVVGTLTEVTSVNDEMVRARVVDPTGAFVVYAGQYQPDELAFLEGTEPPEFVAVTGKARTFQPDDSDQVYTSIRPESIATVDADTRDRWVVSAAEQTIDRIGTYAGAAELDASGETLTDALLEAGVESGLAAGVPLAQDHYGTTPSYLAALRACTLEAVEVVAGDRDQVSGLDIAPDATTPDFETTFASLADLDGVDREALEASADSTPEAEPQSMEPAMATAGGSPQAADPADTQHGSAAGTATSDGTDTASTTDIDADLETGTADVETDTADADSDADSSDTGESETTATGSESEIDATTAEGDGATAAGDDASGDDELGDFDAGDGDDGMYEMDEEEREQLEAEFGAEFTTGSEVDEPGAADIDVPEPEADEVGETERDSGWGEDEPAADDGTGETDATEPADDLGSPPESGLEAADDGRADESLEQEPEPTNEAEPESDADESPADEGSEADEAEGEDEPADDVDLADYVVETMADLDDGDGADRAALIERVAADTGASTDEVEDAIQDALMGGQCYEPDDETLKAI
ncbi:hypothetical protein [Natrinema longum]|uniref:Rpa-associated protein n=1 Tax=Natrinema longum TaxID=370324 RepID=A0A8A2U9H0_9EURY|nr:hypothetical protein [Natrinema longum]MBZ6494122.1 hypothetical protein [Natrinema longum]QSW84548.1 hypothetical protein J0X27_13970 [Natrinema longum]